MVCCSLQSKTAGPPRKKKILDTPLLSLYFGSSGLFHWMVKLLKLWNHLNIQEQFIWVSFFENTLFLRNARNDFTFLEDWAVWLWVHRPLNLCIVHILRVGYCFIFLRGLGHWIAIIVTELCNGKQNSGTPVKYGIYLRQDKKES